MAFHGTEYTDTAKMIMRSIEQAYIQTANREAVNAATQEGEGGQRFSIRTYHGSGANSNLESASLVGEVDNHPMLNAIHTLYTKGKDFAAKLFNMKYFDVAKTPDFMKEVGLTGDKFTIRYGVISRHFGKDEQHDFTEEEWEQLPKALSNPILITEYYQDENQKKQKGYRLYTPLTLSDGSYVVVSAEVKNAGRNLEINAINTIFGRNAVSDVHDKIVWQNPKITPEQSSLLNGNNPHQYPNTQELSAAKIDNSSETAKENGEKFSLKDTKLEKIGDNIYRFTPAKSKESTYMDANGNQLHAVKFETIKGKKWYEGFHAPKDLDIKKVDGKYEVEYLFGTYDNLDDAVEQLGKLYDQSRFRKVGDGIQAEFQDKGIVKPAKVVKFVTKEQADTISMLTGKSLADVIAMKTKFSLKDEKTLVGVHNITEDKLRKALNQGGLANPSVAIVDSAKQIHEGYGGISLIMPNQMIAKRTGQNAGTFFGDAWTPSYPHVERQLGKNGGSAMREDIDKLPSGMQSLMQSAMQSYLDGRNEDGLAYMFLSETGRKPEMVKRESEYSDEEIAKVGKLTNGTYDTEGLSEESKQALFDLYLQHKGKTRKEWDESVEPMKANLRETLKNTKEGSFPHNRAEMNLAQLEEYGYFPKNVNALVNGVRTAKAISGTADYYGTSDAAMKRVREDGLTKEYNNWLAEKDERYGIKEVIFDGYTPSGNRKYVPNDLKHVSQLMKKAGRNGAEGSGFSFNSFVAEALQSTGNLDKIRARKSQLTNDHADVDAFTDKWGDTYIHLASAVNPEGGDVFNDTGYARLKEMAGQRNPIAYAKKEYGVSLSEKDAKQFNDMLAAIREERPTMYFETKFERPVMFNEFSAAVVPSDMDANVRKGLEATGLRLYDYDANKEGDRQRAFVEAINGGEDIRFSLVGEQGATAADDEDRVTTRMDNLQIAQAMEKEKKDAKAIKLATGWERGADGRWRYEIPDFQFNYDKWKDKNKEVRDGMSDKDFRSLKRYTNDFYEDMSPVRKRNFDELRRRTGYKIEEELTLGDVLDGKGAKNLFKYYPELRDVKFEYAYLGAYTIGSFDPETNTIKVNQSFMYNPRMTMLNLLHEVQHAIQRIEGFARGGSENAVRNDMNKKLDEVTKQIKQLKAEGKTDEAKVLIDKNKGLYNAYANEKDDFKNYQALAGEVEARNVQTRMGMADEERRNSLASETEDVAREDQIFLWQDDGYTKFSIKRFGTDIANASDRIKNLMDNEKIISRRIGSRAQAQNRVLDTLSRASSEYRRANQASAKSGQDTWEKDRALGHVIQASYGTGAFLTEEELGDILGEKVGKGNENYVYRSKDGKTVFKLNNLLMVDKEFRFNEFLDRIKAHNEFAPEDMYTPIGFALNEEGDFCVVLEQPYVQDSLPATQEEIDDYMEEHGYDLCPIRVSADEVGAGWSNGEFEIWDTKPRNVLKDKNGDLHFIDTVIQHTFIDGHNDKMRFSLRVDQYQHDLAQWKKDNNLPKDAERPAIPVREPNETAVDFANRVKEYRRQMALWKTAPQYEDHLLTDDTAQGQFNLELNYLNYSRTTIALKSYGHGFQTVRL